jgi:hypothetical protein
MCRDVRGVNFEQMNMFSGMNSNVYLHVTMSIGSGVSEVLVVCLALAVEAHWGLMVCRVCSTLAYELNL